MTEYKAEGMLEAAVRSGNVEDAMHDLINTSGLDKQHLSQFELSKIDFNGKVLTDLTLLEVRLDQCDFTRCTFNQVNFINCVISRANFSEATFIDCIFEITNFVECNWTAVHSNHMKFNDCAGRSLLDLTKPGSLVKMLDLVNYNIEDNSELS